MNHLKPIYLIFLCFIASSCYSLNKKDTLNEPIIMFKNWVLGIKNKDFEKFKDAYLQSEWNKMTMEEKSDLMDSYSKSFDAKFGDYKIEDFNVTYQGSRNKGKLIIKFKGKDLPSLMVKKVKNDWILAEK